MKLKRVKSQAMEIIALLTQLFQSETSDSVIQIQTQTQKRMVALAPNAP